MGVVAFAFSKSLFVINFSTSSARPSIQARRQRAEFNSVLSE